MMAKVFISSTGKDIAAYRQAAIEVCNRLGLVPIAMEFFEAMGAGATEGSKRKLDEADVYVGVFAHRYGYIEKGFDKSVTEIEYDYAGERNIDRLCFLLQPDYPWPPDLIDYENYDKLEAFKQGIDSSVIRAQFTTVDSFKAELIQALVEWQQRHDVELEDGDKGEAASRLNVPQRPALLIGREDDVRRVKARLGIAPDSSQLPLTIIRGWPGVGKTTFVNSLVYDEDVQDAFGDILWTTLGERASVYASLADWADQLGIPDVGATLDEAIERLRAALSHRQALLVVDDVWEADNALPFKLIRGPDCSLLITTRIPKVAHRLADVADDDIYELGVLTEENALALLHRLTHRVVEQYPEESRTLVSDLEGLPLAIRVAGRMLDREVALGVDVRPLMDEIRESHKLLETVAPDDRFDPELGTTPTVKLLLARSTDRLDAETRDRFAMLGAFAPKPATFDLDAMAYVWQVDDPLPTVRELVDRGLLEPRPADGRFWLHALLVKHAESLLEDDAAEHE